MRFLESDVEGRGEFTTKGKRERDMSRNHNPTWLQKTSGRTWLAGSTASTRTIAALATELDACRMTAAVLIHSATEERKENTFLLDLLVG